MQVENNLVIDIDGDGEFNIDVDVAIVNFFSLEVQSSFTTIGNLTVEQIQEGFSTNNNPTAEDDSATTTTDTPVEIDVLANDSDVDGDTIRIEEFDESGAHGTVNFDANGTPDDTTDDLLVYEANGDFTGTDLFSYSISDGNGGTDTATVEVTVEPTVPGADDDVLIGTPDDEVLSGGLGNDLLDGGDGDDTVNGGAGEDTVIGGGAGSNILIGGSEGDLFVLPTDAAVANVADADTILAFQINFVDPTTSIDTIGLTDGLTENDLTLQQVGDDTIIRITESNLILGVLESVDADRLSGNFVSVELPLG